MALSFTRISWLWLGGKEKEKVSHGSLINSLNSLGEWGLGLRGDSESLKFQSSKGGEFTRMPPSSSNRKSKKKWKSREDRSNNRIDREYDVVLVPSDGVGLSGSESDDSDWSIGWLEPHAPDFRSDDDDSFAVLVPCYRNGCQELAGKEEEEEPSVKFLSSAKNLPNGYSAGGREYMEQWLSSLQNS